MRNYIVLSESVFTVRVYLVAEGVDFGADLCRDVDCSALRIPGTALERDDFVVSRRQRRDFRGDVASGILCYTPVMQYMSS